MVGNGKFQKKCAVWLLIILCGVGLACLALPEAAESRESDGRYVATDWARRYNGPIDGEDLATAIAVDGQGNVYVSGSSGADNILTISDFLTIKYDPDGRRLWTRRYHIPENYRNYATAMAVDSQGNVHVAGYSVEQRVKYEDDTIFVIIKYDTNGQLLWERNYNGPVSYGANIPTAIAVDAQGNVLVTGSSIRLGTLFGSYYDYATIKYSRDGEELWVRRYPGSASGDAGAYAMALDSQGNVYVTGWSWESGTEEDYATVKYSPEGEELWVRHYHGPGNEPGFKKDYARAIAVDGQGNVLVTGNSWGLETKSDFATIKYSPEGRRLWVRRYGSVNWDDSNAIIADIQGNVYVSGYSSGGYATIKYSPAGRRLWVRRYQGSGIGSDYGANAMALDSQGNVYVTGASIGSANKYEYATIKYSPEGRRLWVRRYTGTGNGSFATAIALDGQDNVFVTGDSRAQGQENDYLTIKYRQTP